MTTTGEGPRQPVDFQALAASLLERAEVLVPQWLPTGIKRGRYWYVGDFDGGEGKSANVNLRTGAWGDNGHPGDAGKDLLSLYRRVFGHPTMLEAALDLTGGARWARVLAAPAPPPKRKRDTPDWQPIHPVPDNAPHYRAQWAHYARGKPTAHWEYRNRAGQLLGVVCRFDKSDGTKDVQPLAWCQSAAGELAWRYKAFASPRPLYGLERLGPPSAAAAPLVVVVEGEKKADKLFEALGCTVPVLGWPGGCNVVHLADWAALAGVQRVVCWPDADAQLDKRTQQLLPAEEQPGLAAMRKVQATLRALGVQADVVDTGAPGTRSPGWDAADAVAEGWAADDLRRFMGRTLAEPKPAEAAAESAPAAGAQSQAPAPVAAAGGGNAGGTSPPGPAARAGGEGGDGGNLRWRDGYVALKGSTAACVANVMLVLHEHPAWRGVLAFDEFAQRTVKRKPAPYDPEDLPLPGEWGDVDDTRAAAWIARSEGFVPSSSMVAEAANEAAHAAPYHPVLDWLRPLRHDGKERIDHWLADFLGVPDSPYTRLVSRYYLIGMCMRVLKPGCKFDTCLVLEGPQGRKKSTALRVLAGEWFSDTELDLAHKDSMSYIRGKWLHEFGELGSLARTEEMRQKSFLSRQVDEFRPSYGRREIRCARQVAFAGTTNQWQWNKDPTGGRRFWPVEVGEELRIEALQEAREQLFAEAFAAALAGERYWPDANEQAELFDPEQASRETPEVFVEILGAWLESHEGMLLQEFSIADACLKGLKLDAKALQRDVQTRVGIALKKLGCERVERRNAVVRFMYKRPERKAASSTSTAQQHAEDVPF